MIALLRIEKCLPTLDNSVFVLQLAHNKDVLEVSNEGTGGLFVNPSGYVHDIVAIRHIAPEKLMLLGRPSQEHSWFPGYAWTIANCGACGQHLVSLPLHSSGYVHDIVVSIHIALENLMLLGRPS